MIFNYTKETARLPWRIRLAVEDKAINRIRTYQVTSLLVTASLLIVGIAVNFYLFLCALAAGAIAHWIEKRLFRHALRAIMFEQDLIPTQCFVCGYDLRATSGFRCPECGAEIWNADPSGDETSDEPGERKKGE